MKRRALPRVARHALYWLAISGLLMLIQLPNPAFVGLRLYWQMYLASTLPLLLLATYPLLYGILPQLLVHRRPQRFLGLLAGWLVGSALLSNLLWLSYGAILVPRWFGGQAFLTLSWATMVEDLNFGFFALLVVAGAASAGRVVDDWYQQRQRNEQLRQQQLHTELLLLKSQLQPVFLFETLDTLHQLTHRKAPESPAAVLHLAALLRYLLYDSATAATGPLTEEIAMLQH
ncbi:MAG: histidine kinase, partial [Bacteroidota bacterium]|nr:histidine kinase [Bacteroidota bacterium]